MSTNEAPLVSVITPVYNGADFLAECIESVLRQTYRNFEYIIVNNCSKDRTLEIAKSYADRDGRIRIHDNEKFVGVIENHNLAFRLMSPKSKYCKVVSADDWLFPECLTKMVELAEANPSIGLVGSYSIAGGKVVWDGLEYERQVVNGREICRATLLGGPYVFGAPTTLLYRADLVRAREAFYPWSNPHADTSACYESLEHSDFGFVHQVLSYTRVHSGSQTSNSLKAGSFNRAVIADVARYGPRYLRGDELEGRLSFVLDKYYEWLVPALLEQSLDKEFLQKQKDGLKEIGFELSGPRMVKAALRNGLDALKKPRSTLEKTMARLGKRGQVEARYY